MESMVFVTMQQMAGFASVTQGSLVITALSVRNSPKKNIFYNKNVPAFLFVQKVIH